VILLLFSSISSLGILGGESFDEKPYKMAAKDKRTLVGYGKPFTNLRQMVAHKK